MKSVAAGIREHIQHIIFGLRSVVGSGKGVVLLPELLPFFLYVMKRVRCHGENCKIDGELKRTPKASESCKSTKPMNGRTAPSIKAERSCYTGCFLMNLHSQTPNNRSLCRYTIHSIEPSESHQKKSLLLNAQAPFSTSFSTCKSSASRRFSGLYSYPCADKSSILSHDQSIISFFFLITH